MLSRVASRRRVRLLWWPGVLLWLLSLLILAGTRLVGAAQAAEPERVVRQYLDGVLRQDQRVADSLTGSALLQHRRAQAQPGTVAGAPSAVRISWQVAGERIAIADVLAEAAFAGQQGLSTDLQALRVSLVREAGTWRIYAIEPLPLPQTDGPAPRAPASDVVRSYLRAAAAGEYREALRYLAGPARQQAEANLSLLAQTPVITEIRSLQTQVLQTQGTSIWVQATYEAALPGQPARPVSLLAEVRTVGDQALIVRLDRMGREGQ